MNKLSIRDLELRGKRVFIRVDFNVPMAGDKVEDDTRIRETLPTLRYGIDQGARLVLASHLGRPKGKVDQKYTLAPVAERLRELLGKPVVFAADCVGADAESKSKALRDGEVLLLENVRFHPQEEANDPEFSRQLAQLCDQLFVCDAFGSSHRAHASVVGITKFVRQAAAGLLMEKELTYLGKAVSNPDRPFVAILGGAKVSDKIEVVQNLMKLADAMLIGGAMAYTFLKSQGLPVGKSLVENDKRDLARNVLEEARPPRWCGTVQSACSRTPHSLKALWPPRAPWLRFPLPALPRSSVAGIPSPQSNGPASLQKFPTSPQVAALPSNFLPAKNSRASKPLRTNPKAGRKFKCLVAP